MVCSSGQNPEISYEITITEAYICCCSNDVTSIIKNNVYTFPVLVYKVVKNAVNSVYIT